MEDGAGRLNPDIVPLSGGRQGEEVGEFGEGRGAFGLRRYTLVSYPLSRAAGEGEQASRRTRSAPLSHALGEGWG